MGNDANNIVVRNEWEGQRRYRTEAVRNDQSNRQSYRDVSGWDRCGGQQQPQARLHSRTARTTNSSIWVTSHISVYLAISSAKCQLRCNLKEADFMIIPGASATQKTKSVTVVRHVALDRTKVSM